MDIDYNKLKNFFTVVRCGSVTRASKELNRTQSAVTQSIRGLEKNFGKKLIEWEGKRLKLTRFGELIYQEVDSRILAIDEQLATIMETGEAVGGCIELGIIQDYSTKLHEKLFKWIGEFRKRYPNVSFRLHFDTSSGIETSLLGRKLDIGFLINFRQRHRFQVFEVVEEEHLVVASADYVKKMGPFRAMEQVISSNLIDMDANFSCFFPWVHKHHPNLVSQLTERQPVICVPNFLAIKTLVQLNQGIAVLPGYLIKKDLERGTIVPLLPSLASLNVGLDCAMKMGREMRACEQLFIDYIRQSLPFSDHKIRPK